MAEDPVDEILAIGEPAQLRALAHPLRHRLLFALGGQRATIGQLATALSTTRGNVGYHLNVLRDAGLVRVVARRTVRGGTEHLYQRTARRHVGDARIGAPTVALMHAVGEEVAGAAQELLLTVRYLRMTADQAATLARTLETLVDGADEAAPGELRFGVVAGVYRPADEITSR